MADKAEKITESAVSKAMKPSFETLGRIEKGITKLNAQGNEGAEERVEGARAKKKEDADRKKANTLLEGMLNGIKDLKKTLIDGFTKKMKSGLGMLIASLTVPIVIMVSFFKQLSAEFKFLKSLTGGTLKKLFMPLKNLLSGEGRIGKAIKSTMKFIDKMHGGIFTKIGNFFKSFKQNKTLIKISEIITKVKGSIGKGASWISKIVKPIGKFFSSMIKLGRGLISTSKTAVKIFRWAKGFGKLLGKFFLPITILMSVFDFVTGALEGYDEGGILGGLEGGITKLLQGLIGMPLDLLKKVVGWALGLMGFDKAKESLANFSFSELIDKMVGGFFDTVKGVIGWVKENFKFGTIGESLTSMLNLIWMPAKLFKQWLITPIVEWLGKKLSFDATAFKEFDPLKMVGDAVDNILKFFKGLFDIDWDAGIKKLAPDWVKDVPLVGKWFGGGDDKATPEELEEIKKEKEEKKAKLRKKIAKEKAKPAAGTGGLFTDERDDDEVKEMEAELEKLEKEDLTEEEKKIAKKVKHIERKLKKAKSTRSNSIKKRRIDEINSILDNDKQHGQAITDQLSKTDNKMLGRTATPKSAVKVSSKKVALKGIDWKFISDKEGGSKTDGYVPNPEGSKSGVTIATGFDLGARSIKDLEGLPASLKSKLAPFMGLQGVVAAEALKNRGGLVITQQEAGLIDKMSKGQALKKLKKEWNKNAAIMKGKTFDELSGAQKTVAASVAFQYGSLSKAPKFRNAAQSGDWDGAIGELRNFGDDYGSRRQSEADYLVAARQNRSGETLGELSAENQYAKANMGQGGTNVVAPNNSKTYNTTSQPLVMTASARNINASKLHGITGEAG